MPILLVLATGAAVRAHPTTDAPRLRVRTSETGSMGPSEAGVADTALAFSRPGIDFLAETVSGPHVHSELRPIRGGRIDPVAVVWAGPGTIESLAFPSPRIGDFETVLCSTHGYTHSLDRSVTGGRSWERMPGPDGRSGQSRLDGFTLAGPDTVYAFTQAVAEGAFPSRLTLWRTIDAGRHWTRLSLPPSLYASGAQGADDLLVGGLACPGGASTCRALLDPSTNAGHTWRVVLHPTDGNDQANSSGFLVSMHGRTAWAEAPIPDGTTMGGGMGALYRSMDTGQAWTQVAPAFAWGGRVVQGRTGFPGVPEGITPRRAMTPVATGAGAAEGGLVYLLRARIGVGGKRTVTQTVPAPTPIIPLAVPGGSGLFGIGFPSDPGAVLVASYQSRGSGPRAWTVREEPNGALLAGGSFVSRRLGFVYALDLRNSGPLTGGAPDRRSTAGPLRSTHFTCPLPCGGRASSPRPYGP